VRLPWRRGERASSLDLLVVGLGNPGREYAGTRHNVGFDIVDRLAGAHTDAVWQQGPSAPALVTRWRRPPVDGDATAGMGLERDVLFVKPLTFMNRSGDAVGELMRFYKVDVDDVLIVCDDVNLPLGRLRARAAGSEGGHNGLKSVAEHLGTTAYPRLRVGVGRGDGRRDLADHVLSRFEADERGPVDEAVGRAVEAVDLWIVDGLVRMMNSFNRADERTDEGTTT
jgi:PTH1 family peptidyl-tRNA hydrolase